MLCSLGEEARVFKIEQDATLLASPGTVMTSQGTCRLPLKTCSPIPHLPPPSSSHQAPQAPPLPPGYPLLHPHPPLPTMEGPGHSAGLRPLGPPQHRALPWPLQRRPVPQGDAQEVVIMGTTKAVRGNCRGNYVGPGDSGGVSPVGGCEGHVHTSAERDCRHWFRHGIQRIQKVSPLQLVTVTLHA